MPLPADVKFQAAGLDGSGWFCFVHWPGEQLPVRRVGLYALHASNAFTPRRGLVACVVAWRLTRAQQCVGVKRL
jgi:hypothetical protein